MARLELVELLDGHHVHRAEAIDLGLEGVDRILGRHRPGLRDLIDLLDLLTRLPPPRPRPRRTPPRCVDESGAGAPSRSRRSTSANTSSSGACTASTQVAARCERSVSAVARATSSAVAPPRDVVERVACLPDARVLGVDTRPERRHGLFGVAYVLTKPVERGDRGIEPCSAPPTSRHRGRPVPWSSVLLSVARAERRSSRSRDDSSSRATSPLSADARSTSAAYEARASATCCDRSSTRSRASMSRRCAASKPPSDSCRRTSSAAVDSRASACRSSSRAISSDARRRSDSEHLAFFCRRSASAIARAACASRRDDRLLQFVRFGGRGRRWRRSRTSPRPMPRSAARSEPRPPRVRSRRARAAPSPRLSCRGCRAHRAARRRRRCARRRRGHRRAWQSSRRWRVPAATAASKESAM